MVRTRIRDDQTVDEGFVSELELNTFFGDVVITGTNEDDTNVITAFDNYLPGRGIFVGSDGNVVTTGTNTIQITGFYSEFVTATGSLQGQLDGVIGAAAVNDITVSGVTVTGAVTLASVEGITLIPDGPSSTIVISGTLPQGGITDINAEPGPSITLSGSGSISVTTTGPNEITISGGDPNFPAHPEENALVGAGTVVVTSGSNVTLISGTPHTVNTDTISDAIIGGVGIVVTSGSNETTIDGHLRYTKDENDAIIGGENVTVVSGGNTITISSPNAVAAALVGEGEVVVISGTNEIVISGTPHTVNTDTISNAIIGGTGITVTSGSNETTINGHVRYDKSENDAVLGTDGNTVISGANTITIQSFRPEFVSASGSLQSKIDQNSSDISDNTALITTTSGHLQGQIDSNGVDIAQLFSKTQVDEINTVTGTVTVEGTDGNTVLTAGQTITVQGFRPEFVSASGSLQSQIDAVEGSDVDSVNTLIGDIFIAPGYNTTVDTDGGSNTITVGTFDDDDVDSITASGTTITGTVELFGDDDLTITPMSAAGGGNFTFTIDPGVVRNEQLVSASGYILELAQDIESPTSTVQQGYTANDSTLSTTTSTTYIEKLTLEADTTLVATGTSTEPYRLFWSYEWGFEGANAEFQSQVQIDDVDTVHELSWRPTSTNANDFNIASGFRDMLLSSGTHTIDLDYRSTATNKSSRIRRTRLALVPLTLSPFSDDPDQLGT